MSFLSRNPSVVVTAGVLDQLLSTLVSPLVPQIGSALLNDANYTGPGVVGAVALGIDALRAVPFVVTRTGVINRIGFVITVVGGAGALARCGVYSADPANSYYPATLLADGGSQIADGTTGFKSTVVNIPVEAGQVLWLVYSAGVAAPTINALSAKTDNHLLGSSSANPIVANNSITVSLAHAALPATFPANAALSATAGPAVLIRYA